MNPDEIEYYKILKYNKDDDYRKSLYHIQSIARTTRKESIEQQLDKFDIKDIESYLRKKKLEKINK